MSKITPNSLLFCDFLFLAQASLSQEAPKDIEVAKTTDCTPLPEEVEAKEKAITKNSQQLIRSSFLKESVMKLLSLRN